MLCVMGKISAQCVLYGHDRVKLDKTIKQITAYSEKEGLIITRYKLPLLKTGAKLWGSNDAIKEVFLLTGEKNDIGGILGIGMEDGVFMQLLEVEDVAA